MAKSDSGLQPPVSGKPALGRPSLAQQKLCHETRDIRTPRATGYTYYTRQSESNPRSWVNIAADGGGSKKFKTADLRKQQRARTIAPQPYANEPTP